MATTVQPLTYADLDRIPQEREGDRHEILDGVLVVTPSPIPIHQLASGDFYSVFDGFVRPRRLGRVIAAPVDVVFAPSQVAIPDLVFVRQDRLHIIGPSSIEAAPDIVVEILSPSTRSRDLGKKMRLYARFGVPEYWIVDPVARTIAVHVLRGDHYDLLPNEGGTARSEVLPGLTVDVAAFFAAASL